MPCYGIARAIFAELRARFVHTRGTYSRSSMDSVENRGFFFFFGVSRGATRERPALSFCGKNESRFVRDRRQHVFRSVTNLTGYHGLRTLSLCLFLSAARTKPPSTYARKEGTSVARVHLDHCRRGSVEVVNRFEIRAP